VIPYRFHPEARLEVRAATAWYRERSLAAARGFVTVIEERIRLIRELPDAWPTWIASTDVRRSALRRYPYTVVYVVADGSLVVLAVAHQRRKPGYWLPRLIR
jgi:plasmid stabilization system protein ParE